MRDKTPPIGYHIVYFGGWNPIWVSDSFPIAVNLLRDRLGHPSECQSSKVLAGNCHRTRQMWEKRGSGYFRAWQSLLLVLREAKVQRPKPVIGLAGGIASGKSLVANILAELGAGVINADELNHQVLHRDDVRDTVQRWWGQDIYDDGGRLQRNRLAEIVFSDETKRRKLEGLTHPLVSELRRAAMERFQSDEKIQAIVLDIPLLFEVGQNDLCDHLIFVETDQALRIRRAGEQRGWDAVELRRREKMQEPLDSKRDRSDHVVENNSDLNTLRQRVAVVYHQLLILS